MPPQPHSPAKFHFFYGHRKPSQNRPIVRGGLFSNRLTQTPKPISPVPFPAPFDLQKWDPHSASPPSTTQFPSQAFLSVTRHLSPIARYICNSFRKHRHWGPPIIADLHKLRRVTPDLVAEILKVQTDPNISSKFFFWAGKQKGYKHNFSSYNAFAYCLNRAGRFRSADQVLELMGLQGKQPSEKQFEILIRIHSDACRGLRVYYVYEKMKKFGIRPRVFLYNRVLDALIKTNHLDLALSVYDDFKEDGLKEEGVTFMILVKGLCKAGCIDEVFELLEKMRRELCKPDVFAYTAMVRAFIGERNLDGCLRVWEEMGRDGVEPDAVAYTTLITGLCKGGKVEKGYEVFKEMRGKGCLIDRAVYGSLIEAFVANRKVGSACDLLKEMTGLGYRADLSIYNSLIEGLCNADRADKGYKLFQITVREGLVPSFETINPLLVVYAEHGRIDDFCKLLEQMGKLGISVMDGLSKFFSFMVGKEERVLKALEVFEALKVEGYCSISNFNILIENLHKIGETKRALSLFEEMKGSDFKPDFSTYSNVIPCLVDVGDLKEACSCYNKMKEMSWTPSIAAYCSLVKGLCKIGEINAALMLVRDCLGNVTNGPVEFKYTLTVLHACRSGTAEKVVEVLNEMMQQGCPPDDLIYCAIIYGLCKHGSSDEARKVFAIMGKRNLLTEAKSIIYDELLVDHLKTATAGLVLSGLKFFGLESKLKLLVT
ncbi:pentatricopeptide repeat-containing protein At4g20740-like [Magnolia sinica]|uniref:pentatricopeptide repeat-containing protein At4g20740-like n=1 Tax=Magnolia sinica TaxID=86752 RepID=UPI00265B3D40|nr:pentatricopeptide repeat-containing protein At4g20740-like [Magnolia sinica]XP_058080395.1 pentatricopeptide repeat-containing protein At4g20740-like [Magnolia sinica]XP_058080396.1 pentatricopeptide repeat-containing protein At4g20740-like [Magnolia sinica]XP_058080397.1 pentatricopeptide repeat-containing protein At4g20740-like [Magnolia sinica]XP_058080398.1 pentatricopeptide repeat-containing protein At4g20740-like [Magnolia sinica]XP_058080399.1 pentatricopeptide repeat-containing prot